MPIATPKTLSVVAAALAAATLAVSYGPGFSRSTTAPRHHVVEIQKFKFMPAELTIARGDSVEWVNRDFAPHTATQNNKAWDTKKLIEGQSGRVTFSDAGEEVYICRFHPAMRGKITITAK